jgi:hypothetical protein
MYFLQYSRDKEDENGQAFLGINIITLLIPPSREEEVYFTACLNIDVDFVPFKRAKIKAS